MKRAIIVFAVILTACRSCPGAEPEDSPDYSEMAKLAAQVDELYDQGERIRAVEAITRMLDLMEPFFGGLLAQSYISVLDEVREMYWAQGKFALVEPVLLRQLEIKRVLFGPESLEFSDALGDLGTIALMEGRYAEVDSNCRRALAIQERELGPDHPLVADTLDRLCVACVALGRSDEAETDCERAVAIREKLNEPVRSDLAQSLQNLCSFYASRERFADAERCCQRALAIQEAALGPHDPEIGVSLNNLGAICAQNGQFTKAIAAYERAVVVLRESRPQDHPRTLLASVEGLAKSNRELGRFARAETLFVELLGLQEREYGSEHAKVIATLNNVAAAQVMVGRHVQAAANYERALGISERVHGPNSLTAATILSNMTEPYRHTGRYPEAQRAYERALAIREEALGRDDPGVAECLLGLSRLLWNLGYDAKARACAERALSTFEKAMGPDHPKVADCLSHLAQHHGSAVQREEAERLCQRALAIREKTLGPEHRDVAASLSELATLYRVSGRFARAESLCLRALAIQERTMGPEHQGVAATLIVLALVYRDEGSYARAQPLFERALAITEKTCGPVHPLVAERLQIMGSLYVAVGDFPRARELYARALAMAERALGPEHPDVAGALMSLGGIDAESGQLSRARPLLERALSTFIQSYGPDHPATAMALGNLGSLHMNLGQPELAVSYYERALAIAENSYGPDDPEVADCLENLAGPYQVWGQYARAEPLHRRALAILTNALGSEHPTVARVLTNLAGLVMGRGDFTAAVGLFEQALKISEAAKSSENVETGSCARGLAVALGHMGRYQEAEQLCGRALEIAEDRNSPNYPDAARTLMNLAWLYRRQGRYEAAIATDKKAADAFEASRLQVGHGLERATFLESPYGGLAISCLMGGDSAGAWVARERSQGRVLADVVLAIAPATAGVPETETLGDHAPLRPTGPGADRLQAEGTNERPPFGNSTPSLERVQSCLLPKSAMIGWLDGGATGDSLYGSWAYIVRPDRPVVWVRLDPAASSAPTFGPLPDAASSSQASGPTDLARSQWEALVDPTSTDQLYARVATDFSAARIHPALPLLDGVEDLVVIPSGNMAYVPVESLVDEGGRYLADRFRISYSPSATVYAWLAELRRAPRPLRSATRTLLLGDPPFSDAQVRAMANGDAGTPVADHQAVDSTVLAAARTGDPLALARLKRLPGTRAEVAAIAGLAQSPTLLLGPEATEQELTRLAMTGELAEFGTIHLATHGIADLEQPERSCLVLSQVDLPDAYQAAVDGGRIYDGRLTIQEIIAEWHLNADLVNLSACSTALGRHVSGEGVVGFSHAFLQAGARSLLASLWEVDDEATALLMKRFYDNLWRRQMPKVEALQEAKQWLRQHEDVTGQRPFEHPYFWSAFILIGDRG